MSQALNWPSAWPVHATVASLLEEAEQTARPHLAGRQWAMAQSIIVVLAEAQSGGNGNMTVAELCATVGVSVDDIARPLITLTFLQYVHSEPLGGRQPGGMRLDPFDPDKFRCRLICAQSGYPPD
ncbi:hypothetical protein [Actinocrispum wychmicini]|uniref:MarR family protein n=1 Tax=Actinocrispum wychmicini TaxID=1213861 RepID=A0A4R2IM46_9PSEU|nr:hypothetical protein [Actinocrispum wychmicini]TCO43755.1 hypothetical protein EV192_12818 [Actinocrispum wychmicini]